jgi:hypothetical protein
MRAAAICVLTLSIVTSASEASASCQQITNGKPAGAIEYLRAQKQLAPDERDGACVTMAIRHLEHQASSDAVQVLLDFLDFKQPSSQMDSLRANNDPGRFYPAISTLMTLGQAGIKGLLDLIKNSDSTLIKRNATLVLVGIFRESPPSAVRLLKQESNKTTGSASDALLAAARYASQSCSSRFKSDCAAELTRTGPSS